MYNTSCMVAHRGRLDLLENCLLSLNYQEIKPLIYLLPCEVILEEEIEVIKRCLKDSLCYLLYTYWIYPLQFAANIARNFIYTKYMVTIDGDCIFPPDFFKVFEERITKNPNKIFLANRKLIQSDNEAQETIIINKKLECGSFMGFLTEKFDKIGGLNPFLMPPDSDFINRMTLQGCSREYLPVDYYHQYHPSITYTSRQETTEIASTAKFDSTNKVWRLNDLEINFSILI